MLYLVHNTTNTIKHLIGCPKTVLLSSKLLSTSYYMYMYSHISRLCSRFVVLIDDYYHGVVSDQLAAGSGGPFNSYLKSISVGGPLC